MSETFFKDIITVYHKKDDDFTKMFFDGEDLPKVYFRHNKKANVIDKRL